MGWWISGCREEGSMLREWVKGAAVADSEFSG